MGENTASTTKDWVLPNVDVRSVEQFKTENIVFLNILYVIVEAALLIVLIQSDFTLLHIGLLVTLNLIAFYGLNWKKR